jgi:hypothetical protein
MAGVCQDVYLSGPNHAFDKQTPKGGGCSFRTFVYTVGTADIATGWTEQKTV